MHFKIKKSGTKYKISLNNGEVITTTDDVILENDLLFTKKIDKKLLDKIKKDTLYYDTYHKVLDMISRRLRSESEVYKYLKNKKVDGEDINKIILNLKQIGLINDYNFALAYTHDKIVLSLDGPYKIKHNLEGYNIDSNIINEVVHISDEDINERIDKIISKKSKNNKDSEYVFKQKITLYLINLGYDKDKINERLQLMTFDNSIPLKEMDKIYEKLSQKYSGKDLMFRLKNKLYSKGYKMEEINDFIEKQF